MKACISKGLVHPFGPVCEGAPGVLVLGTFPSVRSRGEGFYYGHPQNRFWRVMAGVFGAPVPGSVDEKRALLISNGVALWDVLAGCDIAGSSDASIKNAVPNPIAELMEEYGIRRVMANGGAAYALYMKYIYPKTGVEARLLPSTSPANAKWSAGRLTEVWAEALKGGNNIC